MTQITPLPLLLAVTSLLSTTFTGLAVATKEDFHPYHLISEIPIGGEGGWDYLSIDVTGRRLFIPHSDRVVVVDLTTGMNVGELSGTPGVHGAVFSSDRAFTSNGRESAVGIFDLKSFKQIGKSSVGKGPDAILFEPSRQEVYSFNGKDRSVTVLDAKTGNLVTTIPLDGRPEFAVADPKAGRVYCNIKDKNELAVIDTANHKVISIWPVTPGKGPSGLAIDTASEKLFLVCSNQMMVMIDGVSGRVLSTVPIGKGADAVVYDPEQALVFSSNGEGNVTVARIVGEKMEVVQTLITEPSARTMALDPLTKRIYLASAKFEPPSPPKPGEGFHWHKVTPGSLKILVYGKE